MSMVAMVTISAGMAYAAYILQGQADTSKLLA